MMSFISVGDNAYVTIEQANNLINKYLVSSDKRRVYWEHLSDSDKDVLIVSGTAKYDTQRFLFKGTKVDKGQQLQFPRMINGYRVEVPESVVYAYLLMSIIDGIQSSNASDINMENVKSFADGSGARIEYKDNSGLEYGNKKNVSGMLNDVFEKYIKEYTLIV